MPNSPGDRFNRKGCGITIAILALFVILYLVVGLSAHSGKSTISKIQTIGEGRP